MGTTAPSTARLVSVFGRIGLQSFGGPAAQIAVMHRILVEETGWLGERQFLNALSFCMMLPGPEAMQLATYAGWRLAGVAGGLIAGLLFVAPGALVMLALGAGYAAYGSVPLVEALFLGIKAGVLVIVVQALLRLAPRALASRTHWLIAALAFAALYLFDLPYPLVVLVAAIWGAALGAATDPATKAVPVALGRTLAILGLGICVWIGPLLLLDGILREIGLFFAGLAVVTFGGAYAVLAWLAQDAVVTIGWLDAGQMLDGLGLAETTPGPLILVTQFVGHLAAYDVGGPWLGLAGAAVTLWATFVPCFLWIFAGAPYIERIASAPRLSGALAGISAAVVGVIANLSLWFALHILFGEVLRHEIGPLVLWQPITGTLDPRVLALSALAAWLLLIRHTGLGLTLTISAAAGFALSAL